MHTCQYGLSQQGTSDVLPDATLHHRDLVAITLDFSLSASATAPCQAPVPCSCYRAERSSAASIRGRLMMTLCPGRLANLVADSTATTRVCPTRSFAINDTSHLRAKLRSWGPPVACVTAFMHELTAAKTCHRPTAHFPHGLI